eukprot:Lankesteria_metandrocarpae@DN4726_c0_g1_i2.p1
MTNAAVVDSESVGEPLIVWEEDLARAFQVSCNAILDLRARHDLERRIRSSLGSTTPHQHHGCSHGGSHHNEDHDAADDVTTLLAEHTCEEGLRNAAGAIAERAQLVYFKVTDRAKAEGHSVNTEEDVEIRKETLREALIRELYARVLLGLRKSHQDVSHDGALLAIPAAYNDGPLDSLKPETIAALMKEGIAVQHGFLGEEMRQTALKDLEFLEFDGKFIDSYQQTTIQLQSGLSHWLAASQLDRIEQRGLFSLTNKLMSLPFELNKKASLLLQTSSMFHLSYFPATDSFYRRHCDSGFGSENTGRKITAYYCPNPVDWDIASDGGQFRVYPRCSKSQWEAKRNQEKGGRGASSNASTTNNTPTDDGSTADAPAATTTAPNNQQSSCTVLLLYFYCSTIVLCTTCCTLMSA